MGSTISKKKTKKKKKSNKVGSKKAKVGIRRPLGDLTEEALKQYFSSLNGHKPGDLYQLVIGEVEKPLLRTVMTYTRGNQSTAAEILGLNRGTLRKKLKTYDLIGD